MQLSVLGAGNEQKSLWCVVGPNSPYSHSPCILAANTLIDCVRPACDELVKNLREQGAVDQYLQDQLVVFAALAAGKSTFRTGVVTLHTRTALWIVEQLCNVRRIWF